MPESYDSPWKEALANFLQPFLQLFFPDVEAAIDWSQPVTFLDTELRKLVRSAKHGKRVADTLVEVGLLSGKRGRLWIHVEVQGRRVSNFAERMYTGNNRIYERYGGPVTSLAVLTDTDPKWRPDKFCRQGFGCNLEFTFPIAKLTDFRERMDELETSSNPFAAFVWAHILTQDSSRDPELRVPFKVRYTRSLYRRGFNREQILLLFNLGDWMLHLEPPYSLQFEQILTQYEKEDHMAYISSIERRGLEKGLEQGLEKGLEQGLQKGLERGREEERARTEAERQRAQAEQERADAEQQRAEALAQKLRELGVDPDSIIS